MVMQLYEAMFHPSFCPKQIFIVADSLSVAAAIASDRGVVLEMRVLTNPAANGNDLILHQDQLEELQKMMAAVAVAKGEYRRELDIPI